METGDQEYKELGADDEDQIFEAASKDEEELLCGPCEPEDAEEEVMPHKTLRTHHTPTQKEKDDHRCLHWPYRSWCRACVFGRGKHSHHMRKNRPP